MRNKMELGGVDVIHSCKYVIFKRKEKEKKNEKEKKRKENE